MGVGDLMCIVSASIQYFVIKLIQILNKHLKSTKHKLID